MIPLLINFLRHDDPKSSKHRNWIHPIISCCVHYAVALPVAFVSHDVLVSWYNNSYLGNDDSWSISGCADHWKENDYDDYARNWNKRYAASWFLALYSAWLVVWRLRFFTPGVFRTVVLYEICWLCNVTLVASSVALATNRPLIASAYCVVIGIDQLLWYIDLAVYFTTGKFPIGVAKYVFWPGVTWMIRITSTHHIWTIPLLLYATYGKIHPLSFPLSLVYMCTSVCISRFTTPAYVTLPDDEETKNKTNNKNVDKIDDKDGSNNNSNNNDVDDKKEGQTEKEVAPAMKYLNVNLSHALWKDIKFAFLQVSRDNPSAPVYLWRLLWRWNGFNFVVFWILHGICKFFYGSEAVSNRAVMC